MGKEEILEKQLRLNFSISDAELGDEDFETAKEDNFYNDHTLVYTKNPENRVQTSDDILQDNLETYFQQNGVKPND